RAASEKRPALISLVVPGYPSPAGTDAVFDAMVEGGADIVEVEIPFSDPLADGATIQNVVFDALESGTTPSDCMEFVRRARSRHAGTPIVFMTYLNPVLAYGVERFAADAEAAGADAIILTDLPPEEASGAKAAFNAHGIDLIFLVAPTSSDERVKIICDNAGGFVYCVSVAGVTGARSDLPPGLNDLLARVRRCTNLPLAVGFGMSRREHIEALSGVADGVVVGSAFMDVIARSGPQESAKAVREYVEVLSGRRRP
ncbi:MAG TPA: tryptophan synthase subunit alpha, partial [Dehalococcoidia bacterium]|nr:tryptophan synthase subunit alpha [Dehalococcoidia bacterium]